MQVRFKPTIWLKPGMLAFYCRGVDVEDHKHNAIHVIIPKCNARFSCSGQAYTDGVVIGSQYPHKVNLEEGWILLIEPFSILGKRLIQFLNGQPIRPIPSGLFAEFPELQQEAPAWPSFRPYLTALKELTGTQNQSKHVIDPRIQALLERLDQCLTGNCKKPAQWRAVSVAKELGLSESRFLHLFRQNIGIAWRPYIRWRRLICAVYALKHQANVTEAAYSAGFSDSPHLCRTFREMFGISIREAVKTFDSAKVDSLKRREDTESLQSK